MRAPRRRGGNVQWWPARLRRQGRAWRRGLPPRSVRTVADVVVPQRLLRPPTGRSADRTPQAGLGPCTAFRGPSEPVTRSAPASLGRGQIRGSWLAPNGASTAPARGSRSPEAAEFQACAEALARRIGRYLLVVNQAPLPARATSHGTRSAVCVPR